MTPATARTCDEVLARIRAAGEIRAFELYDFVPIEKMVYAGAWIERHLYVLRQRGDIERVGRGKYRAVAVRIEGA